MIVVMHPPPLLVVAAVLLLAVVVMGYGRRWTWTGFVGRDGTPKLLWDWLQLLIVPAGLAVALFWLNSAQAERAHRMEERQAARDRAAALDDRREQTLTDYLDRMSELVLSHDVLRVRSRGAAATPVQNLARTLTLTTLSRLDGRRKGVVIAFLDQEGLIAPEHVYDEAALSLAGADLRGAVMPTLPAADLTGADLRAADFSGTELGTVDPSESYAAVVFDSADLRGARFTGASLASVEFDGADARGARFERAVVGATTFLRSFKLSTTTFDGADLRGASFARAHLDDAGLVDADLTGADFSGAAIRYSEFAGSCLTRTDFKRAQIFHSGFAGVDGEAARFTGARLAQTAFTTRGLAPQRTQLMRSVMVVLTHRQARLSGVQPPPIPAPDGKPSCRHVHQQIAAAATDVGRSFGSLDVGTSGSVPMMTINP